MCYFYESFEKLCFYFKRRKNEKAKKPVVYDVKGDRIPSGTKDSGYYTYDPPPSNPAKGD
jgi:hypothetical protein